MISYSAIAFVNGIFLFYYDEKSLAFRLTVFPIGGAFFSVVPSYICGYFLKKYRNTYYTFVRDTKEAEKAENTNLQKRLVLENYERDSFRTIFVYYYLAVLAVLGFLITPIYFMYLKS